MLIQEVLDILNVRKDLDNKLIKTVGNPRYRIKEDSLRILRAIRFATILDFEIDKKTLIYLKKYGHLLKTLSYNRKKEELNKKFTKEKKIKTIIYVQVKQYDGETSDWAVQQIVDFSNSKELGSDNYFSQFWVISSSDFFSEECKNMATANHVRLIDGKEFVQMLLDVGINSLDGFDK